MVKNEKKNKRERLQEDDDGQVPGPSSRISRPVLRELFEPEDSVPELNKSPPKVVTSSSNKITSRNKSATNKRPRSLSTGRSRQKQPKKPKKPLVPPNKGKGTCGSTKGVDENGRPGRPKAGRRVRGPGRPGSFMGPAGGDGDDGDDNRNRDYNVTVFDWSEKMNDLLEILEKRLQQIFDFLISNDTHVEIIRININRNRFHADLHLLHPTSGLVDLHIEIVNQFRSAEYRLDQATSVVRWLNQFLPLIRGDEGYLNYESWFGTVAFRVLRERLNRLENQARNLEALLKEGLIQQTSPLSDRTSFNPQSPQCCPEVVDGRLIETRLILPNHYNALTGGLFLSSVRFTGLLTRVAYDQFFFTLPSEVTRFVRMVNRLELGNPADVPFPARYPTC